MIQLDTVSKRHGAQILFLDASLAVFRGERVGLVGPNGAGKSTVFRLVVGQELPDAGNVNIDRGITIGYFDQNVGEMHGMSVIEATIAGAGEVAGVRTELAALEAAMADPERADELEELVERFGVVQARFDELDGYSIESRARAVLAGLGFSNAVQEGDVGALSGGWKMRVALARVLLMKPDVLLLDEPTNHLDIESIIWLEGFLKSFGGALVLTSHDPAFLNRVVTRIVDIDSGELISYSGDYDFYTQQYRLRQEQQAAQFARQQAMLAKEQAFIDRFKARASHAAQVQSRVKKIEKIEKIEPPKQRKIVEFDFRAPPRSGDDVVGITGVHKAYGDLTIYSGFDLLIRRQERWCVMGVNGAGKSTLLKLVAGSSTPDRGEVRLGAGVKLGYFAQHAMEILKPELSVVGATQDRFPTASLGVLRTLLGAFGFSGDDVEKSCAVLSGGEKARLVLALMLFDPPNLLVLDEPTNHLDMDTKQTLVKVLRGFEGTLLFVSHDRKFLSALSNRVLELGPQGPRVYGGGYDEYVVESGHEAPGLRG
ncbi:MAG TPA: ABC-F family ATP-binding cassette domain-containing protein [Polyangiaceae bacterium]|nr:ABC-F family ATP-binding cassette domain-containing protein [Polyangiaceae bacterium]